MLLSTYYVAAGGSDANNGLSAASPWKTVAKVNAANLVAGDNVLFNRGDVWRETLNITKSGTPTQPITFGAYGAGTTPPELNGSNVITGWTRHSGDIWKATLPANTEVFQVFLNSSRQTLARWPNTGWNSIDATNPPNNYNYLFDTSLTQPDNYWVGATAIVRPTANDIFDYKIKASSQNGQISWEKGAKPITTGWGYYIEGTFKALDAANEWYYDATTNPLAPVLYLQMPANSNPNNFVIEASVRKNDIVCANKQDVRVIGLRTTNSGEEAIAFWNPTRITISGNHVYRSEKGAIICWSDTTYDTVTITGNSINDVDWGMGAIRVGSVTNTTISGNVITNVGNDMKSPRVSMGIAFKGSNTTVTGNTLTNLGGYGIFVINVAGGQSNVSITHNTIIGAVQVMDDQGAIYTDNAKTNMLIEHNTIRNVLGDRSGTPNPGAVHMAAGIFVDEYSSGVTVRGNVVSNTPYGIELHKTNNVNIYNNTIYGVWVAGITLSEKATNQMHHNDVRNNICYLISPAGYGLYINRYSGASAPIGTFDNNLYFNTQSTTVVKYVLPGTTTPIHYYTLAGWKGRTVSTDTIDFGQDAHSKQADPLFVNAGTDFHLKSNSPCINAGTVIDGYLQDLDGTAVPYPYNGITDMGAYEYHGTTLLSTKTKTKVTGKAIEMLLAENDSKEEDDIMDLLLVL